MSQIIKQEVPKEVKDAFDEAAKKYSESEAKTDAGRIFRFILRFISPSTIYKAVLHK